MHRRRWVTAGMVGAVAALTILSAGPAGAATPTSVAAGTPSWSSSVLKATGSFKNNATATATYSYTLQLVRTSAANCSPSSCTNGGTLVLLNTVTSSLSVAKSSTGTTPVLSVKCLSNSTLTSNRYYWSWLKVADSSGNVVYSTSLSLAGKYC